MDKNNRRELKLLANDSPCTDALEESLRIFGFDVTRQYRYGDIPTVLDGARETIGFKSIALRFCCLH